MAKTRGAITQQRLGGLVERDLTVREIAAELDRGYSTVRYWLTQYGLQTTTRARRRALAAPVDLACVTHGVGRHVRSGERYVCVLCRTDAVIRWRRRAKQILVAEAGGACTICGYDRCVRALHFHHRDPVAKRFAIGSRGLARSIEKLRVEAAKCVLLCSNCHAEVEAGLAIIPGTSQPAMAVPR